MMRRNNPIS